MTVAMAGAGNGGRHPRATEFTTVGRTYTNTRLVPRRAAAARGQLWQCQWHGMAWHVTGLLLRRGHARRPRLHARRSSAALLRPAHDDMLCSG